MTDITNGPQAISHFIRRIAVISSSHLNGDSLSALSDGDPSAAYGAPRSDHTAWFCHCLPEPEPGVLPPVLDSILRWARQQGCEFVLFDDDVDAHPDLPILDLET